MKTDKMDNDTFFEKLKELHTAAEIEELLKQVNPVSAEYMKSKELAENVEVCESEALTNIDTKNFKNVEEN